MNEFSPSEKQLRLLCRKSTSIRKRTKNLKTSNKRSEVFDYNELSLFLFFDRWIFVLNTHEITLGDL